MKTFSSVPCVFCSSHKTDTFSPFLLIVFTGHRCFSWVCCDKNIFAIARRKKKNSCHQSAISFSRNCKLYAICPTKLLAIFFLCSSHIFRALILHSQSLLCNLSYQNFSNLLSVFDSHFPKTNPSLTAQHSNPLQIPPPVFLGVFITGFASSWPRKVVACRSALGHPTSPGTQEIARR